MRARLALLVLFALAARVSAEDAPAPGSLTALLDRTMRGQPVVAVQMGRPAVALPEGGPGADAPLLDRLQAIAEAASADSAVLIPFAVRSTWAIAPQTQDVVNPELQRLTPLTASSRDDLLTELVQSLTAAQIQRLGGPGLGMADLTPEQRPLLETALRPPLLLQRERGERGDPDPFETTARIEEPLDPNTLRLRAHLTRGIVFHRTGNMTAVIYDRNPPGPQLAWESATVFGDEVIPRFIAAPNRFKASDLDTARLTGAIGIEGVRPLSEVLAHVSTATGLSLAADLPYRDLPVFIGSANLPAGDVLDAIRLALTATWRKLGDTHILAWEKRGLAAVQREIYETLRPFDRSREDDFGMDAASMRADRRLAEQLPFHPEDPLALTDEQRRFFLSVDMGDTAYMVARDDPDPSVLDRTTIPFSHLTPDQQDRLRDLARQAYVFRSADGQRGRGELTTEELNAVRMDGTFRVLLRVSAPNVPDAILRQSIYFIDMHRLPDNLEEAITTASALRGPGDPEDVKPGPVSLHAPVRALVAPVLGPGRLNQLADEMARAGLNTLFYPALYGGYATFPADGFPLHPALREADGLAAAVAAMKPKNIRVVAYLHTLAWQNEGDPVHWLSKHPEWMARDVLGRPRLDWAKANPAERLYRHGLRTPLRNYVTPRAPEVEARLSRFLDDLAARDGVAGVAFAEWAPLEADGDSLDNPILPPLGYTLQDRLALFRAVGADPVDAYTYWMEIAPPLLTERYRTITSDEEAAMALERQEEDAEAVEPYVPLLARLLMRVRAARPETVTYVFDEPNGLSLVLGAERKRRAEEAPKPDVVLGRSAFDEPGRGLWVRVPPRRPGAWEGEEGMDPAWRAAYARLPALHLGLNLDVDGSPDDLPDSVQGATIVLDFREAPEEISDSLRWVRPVRSESAE